jgi:uncharacterized membrane protein YsdA (DUF1294 family)
MRVWIYGPSDMNIVLILLCAGIYLTVTSVIAYRAFAADKLFAINKQQRTPEARLLHLARIGGWAGAKLAQQRLRHKSYKEPFRSRLNLIGVMHAMIAVTLVLTWGVLALAPAMPPTVTTALAMVTTEPPGATALSPAGAQPAISLRPPAVRPATW